tara:strand:- start:919 stop:1170 length:252 start_codon:yes stop_codon:yes gene_type:complete
MNILEEALKTVEERGKSYGDPHDLFREIAALWSVWLKAGVSSKDVAYMMILLKLARDKVGNSSHDNKVDIAGYASVLSMLEKT